MFWKKSILNTFANFAEKQLVQKSAFNKTADQACILSIKRLLHKCFPVIFAKLLRTFSL